MICIATKDIVPDDVKCDLENSEKNSNKSLQEFVSARLIYKTKEFHSVLPKLNSKTMAHIYKVKFDADKIKTFKADCDLFRRLLIANSSGREINMRNILQRELYPVPLSQATTNGSLRPTNKGHFKAIVTAADGICNKKLP